MQSSDKHRESVTGGIYIDSDVQKMQRIGFREVSDQIDADK